MRLNPGFRSLVCATGMALSIIPVAPTFAAGINYENGLGQFFRNFYVGDGYIRNDQELDDPYNDYDLPQGSDQTTTLSQRGNGALADSYTDTLTTVTNGTGASYINEATVNRSDLTDTGFSIDFNVFLDPGDGSLTQQTMSGETQQLVEMTLTDTTTFNITLDYDSLVNSGVGSTGVNYAIWNTSFCNYGDSSCEMFLGQTSWDQTSASSGTQSASVTLGPGDYMFFMAAAARYDGSRTAADLGFNSTVTVSAVPVPAAVWLFGSALAGLGWMRRKQAA